MAKSIKKSFKYLIIALGVLLMLPGVLYPLLQLSAVQTYLVNRVSSHIFKGLNSSISIGKIDYRFFNKLAVNDILIRDQHNDTLLYTAEIVAGIRRFDLDNKIIRLGKISIVKPVIGLITDSAGVMNLDYFLKQLQNPGDTASKKNIFPVNRADRT